VQQILFRVFFGVVLAGVVIGVVMNAYYDISAGSNINVVLQDLATLARKGDAQELLERQFVKTLVLEGEMPLPKLHSLLVDTLRFALLVRQVPNTTPKFSTVWSEQRFAISGEVGLFDQNGNNRFSFTAVMWNRLDNDGNEHWILNSWKDPDITAKNYASMLKKAVDREELLIRLHDSLLNPKGSVHFLNAQRKQKSLLAELTTLKATTDILKLYKPKGALLNELESFWKEKDKQKRKEGVRFLLGQTASMTNEEIEAVQNTLNMLHKATLMVDPDPDAALKGLGELRKKLACDAVLKNVRARLAMVAGVAFLHAAATPKHPWRLTLQRARAWMRLPQKMFLNAMITFLGLKPEWGERASAVIKAFPKEAREAVASLPPKRAQWFKNFLKYLAHREKITDCNALIGRLRATLGAIGRIPDPAIRKELYKLARDAAQDKADIKDVLLKFASPKVLFVSAVLEAERILKESEDRKDAITAYLRKAIAAVENDKKRADFLNRLKALEQPNTPFCVEPLIADIASEGIQTYPGGGRLSLLVSGFMKGLLDRRGGFAARARALAASIEELSDPYRRREWVLTGSDKPPRIAGLLDWLEIPFAFPEDVRQKLVKKAEEIIASDTASPKPLFKAFASALTNSDVVARVKLLMLRQLLDEKFPSCNEVLRLRNLVDGLLLCSKEGYKALLRDLRGVSSTREITRNFFERLLRRTIAKPQALKRDPVYAIRKYARRVPTAVFKLRKYTLKEEDASITDMETILNKTEAVAKKIAQLKDFLPLYDETLLNECERLADEIFAPTSQKKKRLAKLYFETLTFKGTLQNYLKDHKDDIELLKSVFEESDKKQYRDMVEQEPPDWQKTMLQLIMRRAGCFSYLRIKRRIMLMRASHKLTPDDAIENVEKFLNSRRCIEVTFAQDMAATLRSLVLEHKKDLTSKERKERLTMFLRKLFSEKPEGDFAEFARKKSQDALKLVQTPANIRIHLVNAASDFLSSYLLGNRERAYYLSNALEKVVWLKEDALLPKIVEEMVSDMESGMTLKQLSVYAGKGLGRSEKRRRDQVDGVVSSAIAKVGSELAHCITNLSLGVGSYDDICPLVDGANKATCQKILESLSKAFGGSAQKKKWDFIELRKTYKLADYKRLAQLRRFRFERFSDRRARIRKLAKELLSLIRGREEEDYLKEEGGQPVYEKVMDLCYKLRLECDRTYDESEYVHLDAFVVKRLDEDWRQRWLISDVGELKQASKTEDIGRAEEQRRERLLQWRK